MENYINTNKGFQNDPVASSENLTNANNNMLNEIRVISTKFCIASRFDTIDFVDCIFDLIECSVGNYYNPVSFRYNMDPTFWKELIDSYSTY